MKASDFWQSKGFCNCDHMTEHGVAKAKAILARQERAKHREAKERIKTRAQWMKEAQAAVNAYVRTRDRGRPCISCDRPDDGSHQRHASHYRSVKACSALRFNLRNIHASCAQCNTYLSSNAIEYRIRLIGKVSQEYVDFLESQNQTRRYEIDYLIRLKSIFIRKRKIILERQGDG